MLEGIIVKGYSGFYYVQSGSFLWECSLRGRYRVKEQDFLVGDRVLIKPVSDTRAVIEKVMERKNQLNRPLVANIDQVIIVMALTLPEPDLMLLDRLLVLTEYHDLTPIICWNKGDLVEESQIPNFLHTYARTGYSLVITSAKTGTGIDQLKEALKDKISVMAGPSGVGKSSLLNVVQPGLSLKTGKVGAKSGKGRHTTRHVELLKLEFGGFVADTPGFSRLDLPPVEREELTYLFPEIAHQAFNCKFSSCLHHTEPGCMVRSALDEGKIHRIRYDHYCYFLDEIGQRERRY